MKRVAIVGADFAPSSYPPSLRIRFFAQHLPEFGYEPIIVTTQPKYYQWSVDEENNNLVPDWMTVIRTAALKEKYTRPLGIGDVGMRSIGRHWRTISRLCRQKRIDLLYVSVPPYVPMILGRLAHRRFGIPYVIDYQDPWRTEYYSTLPPEQRPPKWLLAYNMARILEPFALKEVDLIAGVSQGTLDAVQEYYPWLAQTPTVVAPLGGEKADFDYLRQHSRRNLIFDPTDGSLHLSYIGVLPPSMNATLRALLEAVKRGLQEQPELFERLKLHFVGTTYAVDAENHYKVLPISQELGIAEFVDERPLRVPYLDALQLMIDSHGLLAIGSEEAHYTASKIFPNILAQRPLLAIFHEASTVVEIVNSSCAGEVVTFSDQNPPSQQIESIVAALARLLNFPGDYQPPTQWGKFEAYTARSTARTLAAAFDKVLADN